MTGHSSRKLPVGTLSKPVILVMAGPTIPSTGGDLTQLSPTELPQLLRTQTTSHSINK